MPRRLDIERFMGIDPGKNGGIAIVTRSGTSAWKMPPTERDVWDLIYSLKPCVAVIEKVHSMPKQGVVSSFTFGMGYGGLRMALTAADIPFEDVRPAVWMRGLAFPSRKKAEGNSQWKNRLKGKAQQLFPKIKVTLSTADALLIAKFCQLKNTGKL